MSFEIDLGATYLGKGRCQFRVWAPYARKVEVHFVAPDRRTIPLKRQDGGYHQVITGDVGPEALYLYSLDGQMARPDPASRFQPTGVHGPSQVIDPNYQWDDHGWCGLPLRKYIIYELHVGTFTPEGTFLALLGHLDQLKSLGITAIELMPVAQFPGERNWGYDGVYPFAVQNSYGGPEALKALINACHHRELVVVLDVVYNHLGPEGNYFGYYGPYFTDRYITPWGAAINFDGPHSDDVRQFFIQNALFWIAEYHVDALRIDAVHAILDFSAQPFLEELAEAVHEFADHLKRQVYLIAESALNDTRIIRSPDLGGFNIDGQWNDDFHHALHTLLTGEKSGYYQDFGRLQDLVKAYREGFVYSGQYSPYRARRHGNSSAEIKAHRFVVFAQNHDQVGNRMGGERLAQLISFEGLKLAAAAVLLSPFIPLIFMGEEYAESAPFPFFISHSDHHLIEAVQKGRHEEFVAFGWPGRQPDPQDEVTFLSAKLSHRLRQQSHHRVFFAYYKELIKLRKEVPALAELSKEHLAVQEYEEQLVILVQRWSGPDEAALLLHFGTQPAVLSISLPTGRWFKRIDSTEKIWRGPGCTVPDHIQSEGAVTLNLTPQSSILLARERDD